MVAKNEILNENYRGGSWGQDHDSDKSKEKLSKRGENSQQDNFLPGTFQISWFISFLNFAKALWNVASPRRHSSFLSVSLPSKLRCHLQVFTLHVKLVQWKFTLRAPCRWYKKILYKSEKGFKVREGANGQERFDSQGYLCRLMWIHRFWPS